MSKNYGRLCVWLCLCAATGHVLGDDDPPGREWPFCPAPPPIPPRPVVEETLAPGDIHVLADRVNLTDQGVSHLVGNVQMTKDQQQVTAQRVDYDKAADRADLSGDVNYWDDRVYLHGESAQLYFDDGTGNMQSATYQLVNDRGRGSADELILDVGTRTQGKRVTYTTCDPEADGVDLASNAWRISASSIDLNHDTERGSARNVVLRVKDIPVLYLPYLSFPLSDKRKTGFLAPGFGSTSNHGFEILAPFYLNLAPHMDATVTPRVLTDSGVMGMGEFRYLLGDGGGKLNVEYLPNDDQFNDENRSLIGFSHDQDFGRRGRLFLTYNSVSDKQYLEDFGSQLRVTATRFLERRADFSYRGGWWRASARVQDFQITDDSVDPASEPYQKLPQVRFHVAPLRGRNRLNASLTGDFAYFNRDSDIYVDEVNGGRVDMYPSISYPLETRSAFLTPKIGVRFTQYDLSDTGPFASSPSRILPIASVDSGLFLERGFDLAGIPHVHTLEPRLYYLYIPDDRQDDIPVFDSSIFNQSYSTLFRENRFTSIDRMGDANQFALGITSRLINRNNGEELGYIRIGEQYFLSDQDVIRLQLQPDGTLVPDGRTTTDFVGPIIGEAGIRLFDDWKLKGEMQWEPNENITEKLVLRAQYVPGDGRVLNLAYRVRRAPSGEVRRNVVDVEQTDVSFRLPLRPDFAVVGRWNYAVPEGKSLELFAGIEYESCCFGIRAVARRFLNNLDGDFSTGVFLQIELKGLGGIGRDAVQFLNQRIPGYESEF
jgi:LPS-assembly protein